MKIAIFSDTFPPQINGVASQVNFSAKILSENNHKVWVFTASRKVPHDQSRKFEIINYFSIPAFVYKGLRLAIPSGKAYRMLRKIRPDIIHSHTPFAMGWEAVIAAKLLKIPIVGTHHTFYEYYLKHIKLDFGWTKKLYRKYISFYYNSCDLVLDPSKISIQEFSEAGIKKPMEVLSNAIDTDLFFPVDENRKKILKEKFGLKGKSVVYMGRLSYEKSIDVLIKEFSSAVQKNTNLEFMIVGDGPEKDNLIELAEKLNIRKKIIFTGFLSGNKLSEALQANEIFASASKTETFGIAVLEGMATGLPVVVAAEKSFLELVRNGIDGFLVPSDNVGEMADKISYLLENDEIRKKISFSVRARPLMYSRKDSIEKLETLYKKALGPQKIRVCLYLEFRHFLGGYIFKKMGTGSETSYKNQKKMLIDAGFFLTEKWENSCDILMLNSVWMKSFFLAKKAKRRGKKLIIWTHATAEDFEGFFRLKMMDKLMTKIFKKYIIYLYGLADMLLCPSEYTKDVISGYGFPDDKLIVQSNGVDTDKFYADFEERKRFREKKKMTGTVAGNVGIVIPRKGVDTFLSMVDKFPHNKFFWFGKIFSGLLVKPIPKDISRNVYFTGYVEIKDINAVFNALDIFFFPSYEENQGMSLLEAAAVGLPILARDIPVYRNWLIHNENCLKAKTDEEFEKYLQLLIEDKVLRERLGKNAQIMAQKNSLKVLGEKLGEICKNLVR